MIFKQASMPACLGVKILFLLCALCVSAAAWADPLVIVHRGVTANSIENTLGAIAETAAFEADGLEIDVRQTADGVLVLFHDDMLDVDTDGWGNVSDWTLDELRSFGLRDPLGRTVEAAQIPTFDEALESITERGLLVHLDVKQPGIEDAISESMESHELWPDVVFVNESNGTILRRDSRYRPRQYAGPLYHAQEDWDPDSIQNMLESAAGRMVMVDDPRLVIALRDNRTSHRFAGKQLGPNVRNPPGRADEDPEPVTHAVTRLEELALHHARAGTRSSPQSFIAERTRLVRTLGRSGQGTDDRVVGALMEIARDRITLHDNWMWDAVDRAAALRALADLGVKEVVPVAVQTLDEVRLPEGGELEGARAGWWRLRDEALRVLGRLRVPESEAVLREYINRNRQQSLANLSLATRALLEHALTNDQLRSLAEDERTAVAGTARQWIYDHGTDAQRQLLPSVDPRFGRLVEEIQLP